MAHGSLVIAGDPGSRGGHGLRFAFAGRVSTEDLQSPDDSRGWQLDRAQALIAGHGRIVQEFFDVGQSRSTSWLRRPQSARLLEALADPGRGFDAIVVGEPQRVFYDNQFGHVSPLFAHYRVGLWIPELGGPMDFDSEVHGLTMAIFSQLAKAERRRIQIRVRAAMSAKARHEGRFLGGRPPYGYQLADAGPHPNPEYARVGARLHRLELDTAAAPVVRRIFARRAEGWSARRIARDLDASHIPCPSAHDPGRNPHRHGSAWSPGAVQAILSNPRYLGHQVWGKQRKVDTLIDPHNVPLGTRPLFVWNQPEDWIWSHDLAQPAIIDNELWQKVQHAPVHRTPRSPNHAYLLSGLLRCAHCGKRLESAWNNNQATYRCKHSAPAPAGEARPTRTPKSLSVNEKTIVAHLPTLLIRLGNASEYTDNEALHRAEPRADPRTQTELLRTLGVTLSYDHIGRTITAEGREPITVKIG